MIHSLQRQVYLHLPPYKCHCILHRNIITLMSTYVAVGYGKALHADCAVLLRPLSPWQPDGIIRPLSKVAKLLSHVCALVRIDLSWTVALTHHDPHVIANPVSSGQELFPFLILLCP